MKRVVVSTVYFVAYVYVYSTMAMIPSSFAPNVTRMMVEAGSAFYVEFWSQTQSKPGDATVNCLLWISLIGNQWSSKAFSTGFIEVVLTKLTRLLSREPSPTLERFFMRQVRSRAWSIRRSSWSSSTSWSRTCLSHCLTTFASAMLVKRALHYQACVSET